MYKLCTVNVRSEKKYEEKKFVRGTKNKNEKIKMTMKSLKKNE